MLSFIVRTSPFHFIILHVATYHTLDLQKLTTIRFKGSFILAGKEQKKQKKQKKQHDNSGENILTMQCTLLTIIISLSYYRSS